MLGEKNGMGAYTLQSTAVTGSASTTSNFPIDEGAPSSNAAISSAPLSSLELQSCKANVIGNNDASNLAAPKAPSPTTSQAQNQNVPKPFKINDRVRISATREGCIALQAGHGGWNPRMESV